jgi:hypothetical protein
MQRLQRQFCGQRPGRQENNCRYRAWAWLRNAGNTVPMVSANARWRLRQQRAGLHTGVVHATGQITLAGAKRQLGNSSACRPLAQLPVRMLALRPHQKARNNVPKRPAGRWPTNFVDVGCSAWSTTSK